MDLTVFSCGSVRPETIFCSFVHYKNSEIITLNSFLIISVYFKKSDVNISHYVILHYLHTYITHTCLPAHNCPWFPMQKKWWIWSRKNIQKVNQVKGEKIKGDTKEAADKNNMVFLFSFFYFQEHFSELETSLHNNTLRKSHCGSMIWFVQPEWRLSELLWLAPYSTYGTHNWIKDLLAKALEMPSGKWRWIKASWRQCFLFYFTVLSESLNVAPSKRLVTKSTRNFIPIWLWTTKSGQLFSSAIFIFFQPICECWLWMLYHCFGIHI